MSHKKSNTTLVREYIRDLIVRQGLKPGDRLPCEGDIAAELEISKSSVREATHALESIGLIEIRHGIGLVLRNFNLDAIADIFNYGFALEPSIVVELYDLRRLMETALMPRVVAAITESQLQECETILKDWEILVDANEPAYEADGRFHDALYSVVSNRMLTSLCHIFWKSYRDLEDARKINREKPYSLEKAHRIIEDHRMILEAVRSRNSDLASKRMYEHFSGIQSSHSQKESN